MKSVESVRGTAAGVTRIRKLEKQIQIILLPRTIFLEGMPENLAAGPKKKKGVLRVDLWGKAPGEIVG